MLRRRLGDDRFLGLRDVLGHGHLLAHGLLVHGLLWHGLLLVDQIVQRGVVRWHLVVIRGHLVVVRGQMMGGGSRNLTRARNGQLGVGLLASGTILHAGKAVDRRGIGIREDVVRIRSLRRLLGVEGLLLV